MGGGEGVGLRLRERERGEREYKRLRLLAHCKRSAGGGVGVGGGGVLVAVLSRHPLWIISGLSGGGGMAYKFPKKPTSQYRNRKQILAMPLFQTTERREGGKGRRVEREGQRERRW